MEKGITISELTMRHWRKLSPIGKESEKEGESTRITSTERMKEIEGTILSLKALCGLGLC